MTKAITYHIECCPTVPELFDSLEMFCAFEVHLTNLHR
jgi:hypothetical protein